MTGDKISEALAKEDAAKKLDSLTCVVSRTCGEKRKQGSEETLYDSGAEETLKPSVMKTFEAYYKTITTQTGDKV